MKARDLRESLIEQINSADDKLLQEIKAIIEQYHKNNEAELINDDLANRRFYNGEEVGDIIKKWTID
ncbi:hypothetical protein [Flavobacterium sp. '19STA2R22 D10 B1']|uniref:hypothetical protein n=1 Tax=Flavobacterium aerium TaxID=3037261 RepID=UPI00278BF98E|nr:hypothetical protein [Flavobacterium sp. '19STA2R22 D10 B1']